MKIIKHNQDSHITVGIDIGSQNIMCAIGLVDDDRKAIKLLASSKIDSSGTRRGIITNRDELIKKLEVLLNDCEKMADKKISNAILSITGEHVRCLNTQAAIALNRNNGGNQGNSLGRGIRSEDISQVLDQAQAVSLPSDRDILHTLPQEYLVDTLEEITNPIGMTGRRLEGRVHLVTAATTAMNNLVSCVEELGISVEGLVFQPLAAGLATLKKDEMELGVTLVEIGATTTNISVYHKSAVRHSAIVPVGSASITNDIALMLQISIDEAEKIKLKYASAESSMSSPELCIDLSHTNNELSRKVSEEEVSKYVEARMLEIFHLVLREISRADIKDPLTYGIVLTGGGSLLRNIIPLAEKTLGVKVRMGYPLKIIGNKEFADGPNHATIMGLLLWPLFAKDHMHISNTTNGGFRNLINKIKHTIDNMF
jgi:cell division protein FtsA